MYFNIVKLIGKFQQSYELSEKHIQNLQKLNVAYQKSSFEVKNQRAWNAQNEDDQVKVLKVQDFQK